MVEKGKKVVTENVDISTDGKKSNPSASFWETFNRNPERAAELMDRISNGLIDLA